MQYYVHYVDYNKRLDEWVTEDRLDTRKIEPPQGKEEKEKAVMQYYVHYVDYNKVHIVLH